MSNSSTILGLDLGTASVGWALVESNGDTPVSIKGMGVRIIPLSPDDKNEFEQGKAISKNQKRTTSRTQRKGLDRYQLRRKALTNLLKEKNMYPDRHLLLELSPLEIWGLRAAAVVERKTLQEIGRIWLHLNQRRGYKHSKTDDLDNSKQTEYVQAVNNRYSLIKENRETIGQHFYKELKKYFSEGEKNEAAFRIKEKVFPRSAYEEEFDCIWKCQRQFYPEVLTDELYQKVKNQIIYYQRKLKSQKGLVSVCEFEGKTITNGSKNLFVGPKVTPKSSPLFQAEKIWESINNIIVKNRTGQTWHISKEKKIELYNFLNQNEKLSQSDLFNLLGIGKNAGYFTNAIIRAKGLQGNTTVSELLKKGLSPDHPSLKFSLTYENFINTQTGEIEETKIVSSSFEKEPLYQLWHSIYSLEEADCLRKLVTKFDIASPIAQKLSTIDFTKGGYGNKSAKAIRKLLPYLNEGLQYDKAYEQAYGKSHSNSLTKEQNLKRSLEDSLRNLPKNSLRQPVVERILNQMINTVNAIIQKYGKPDIIRIELSRELKQSREERNRTFKANNDRERDDIKIENILLEDPYFRKKTVSRNDKIRYRLARELNWASPYEPGKQISIAELFSGEYDIEHIIPSSVRFDDSFSNKTLCPRRFNSGQNAKNSFTAFDYMKDKRGKVDFDNYIEFITKAYSEKRISKTKYTNLLTPGNGITPDFINRSLNETRYISKKSVEILSKICHHVKITSGSVTQRLRDLWGWDKALQQINIPKFREAGQTVMAEVVHNGQTHLEERIKDWSKRDDHRHHAIDALVVACTRQGFIQRINNLNSTENRNQMRDEISGYKNRFSLLDNYLLQFKPFETSFVVEKVKSVTISFKPGKKVCSFSTRKINRNGKKEVAQRNIITPRGPLSEESVYGKIKRKITRAVKIDKKFTFTDQIINDTFKKLVKQRLQKYNNDHETAFENLKKEPIWIDVDKKTFLTEVDIIDFVEEFVIKYPVSTVKKKDLPFIVDKRVRDIISERLAEFDGDDKEAYKNLEQNPIWFNKKNKIPVKSVRLYTKIGADAVMPIKVYDNTWDIEYEKYVKPGSNHHIAIYKDEAGKLQEHVVSFWHAVERKKYGIPVIIKNPTEEWTKILATRELTESFLQKLPKDKWQFVTSLQQNESFVFNMTKDELLHALNEHQYSIIAPNIFRVRKLTSGAFWFNQQYETEPRENLADKKARRCVQASLSSMNGVKVKINIIGEIFIAE